MIKFHDDLYVIINNAGLGYSTPLLSTPKVFETKKTQMKKWASEFNWNKLGHGWTEKTIVNKPIGGFKVGKSVSRYSTSNKLFRIHDPRGFELEISAANLEFLIQECEIYRGAIHGKLVWGRVGGMIYLTTPKDPDYLLHLDPPTASGRTPQVGESFLDESNHEHIYLGKYFLSAMSRNSTSEYVYETNMEADRYWLRGARRQVTTYRHWATKDEKPVYVYSDKYEIEVRRSKFKTKSFIDKPLVDVKTIIDNSQWRKMRTGIKTFDDSYANFMKLYDTKQELRQSIDVKEEFMADWFGEIDADRDYANDYNQAIYDDQRFDRLKKEEEANV